MGVKNNEVIIANTWNHEAVEEVRAWLKNIKPPEYKRLFVFIPGIVNDEITIIMAPDCSKKGWDQAEVGERIRNQFIRKIQSFDYSDGSNPFFYVEVGFGEYGQKILRGNCKNRYSYNEYFIATQ